MGKYRDKFDEVDFLAKYVAADKFVHESPIYADFLDAIDDDSFVEDMARGNDSKHIPPVVTLVENYGDLSELDMSDYEKTSIGMCMSYVFRFILNYSDAVEVKVDKKTGVGGIKNASYFVK